MKKFLFLFLMCTSLSLVAPVAPAQDYEDIAECILVSVPKHAIFDGDYLYGVTRDGDLEIFDVSDIFTLTTFTTKPALNPAQYISPAGYGGARSGDYLFLTNQGGSVVDVSNPMAPVQVGIFNTLYRCVNLVVAGKYMVGAEYSFNSPNNNAVEVWDISDPLNVVSVSSYISAEEGWSVAVYGDYLYYASDWSVPVLSILDFSDPTNISLLNSISLSEIPYHMKVVGDKLVTSGTSIIRLFDLTDPLNPVQTDAESVSGRVCAEQGSRIINNDTVHKVVGTDLEFVQNFDDHGNYQGDGFPFGSDSQYVGTEMGGVEVDVVVYFAVTPYAFALQHLGLNRTGDDVPRRQVEQGRRIALHEPLTIPVAQDAALAPHRLGNKDAEPHDAGGMKLVKLHVLERNAPASA